MTSAMNDQSMAREDEASTALVLLAHHHSSGNIASQRFVGLVNYLPRDTHSVFVVSGPPADQIETQINPEVLVIESPLLSKASLAARLEVLRRMAYPNRHLTMYENSWIAQAVNAARARVRSEKAIGRRPVVMATYSPIDALIAARLVAVAENVPLIQDFRDGLAFENLGRPGVIFNLLRKALEAYVVRPATIVTTVSRPLVRHFQETYADKEVSLLYNGFDVGAFSAADVPAKNSERDLGDYSFSIGHFGRVSASEAARLDTLRMFLSTLEKGKFSGELDFFGTLTDVEISILEASGLNCRLHGHVDRKIALEKMRRMSALILLTGKSKSVATGKLYEYLFAGKRIVIATQKRNEATRIIEEIGDDDIVLDFSAPNSILPVEVLVERLSRPFSRNFGAIKKFKKSEQARKFSETLQRVAGK